MPDAEFMDTTTISDASCPDYFPYYYSVGGKYPKNSASLLKDVHYFLQKAGKSYDGSGYITFRFAIDCHGRLLRKVRVMQTNEAYMDYHFSKALVDVLYDFLLTMDKWKAATTPAGDSVNYMAYLSFKIRDGNVVQIIP